MNPQATKKKVIVALVLVVIYIMSAAFDFHPTIVAPVVVVLVALTFFLPSLFAFGASQKNSEAAAFPNDGADVRPASSTDSSSTQIDS